MLALILMCLRQHLRDMHAIGDVLIADEAQLRRAADDDALAQRPADVARGALEGPKEILPLVVLQDADVDLGVAQVAGDLRPGDGEGARDAGIVQLLADDAVHLPANLLGNPVNSLIAHSRSFP